MALISAIALSFASKKIKDFFIKPIQKAQHWVLKALSIFMWLSPLAAYCAMAYLIGKFGIESLIGMLSLDCTNIYLSSCVIFLAQAFDIELSFSHLLSILLILMVTSKGAVGVTG